MYGVIQGFRDTCLHSVFIEQLLCTDCVGFEALSTCSLVGNFCVQQGDKIPLTSPYDYSLCVCVVCVCLFWYTYLHVSESMCVCALCCEGSEFSGQNV